MLKLIIKQKGKIIQKVPLHPGTEYIIGRSKDNDIILPEQPGISRKHLQLSIDDNEQGTVKSLSQISLLNINGEEVNEGVLSIGEVFQIQDFEFLFQKETIVVSETKSEKPPSEVNKGPPVYHKTDSQIKKPTPSSEEPVNPDEQTSRDLLVSNTPDEQDGKTKIMNINTYSEQLSSYLKVSYDDNVPRDIFKLEGEESEWTIGRNEDADIMLDNSNISRKHFKIKKEGNQYFILDLKSANGTILNDKNLTSGKPYPIQSGDAIYILDIEITFETKNISLEKELMKLTPPPVPAPGAPGQSNLPMNYMPPPLPVNMPSVIVEEKPEEPQSFFQKNKKRLIIYGSVIAVVGLVFFGTPKKKEEPEKKMPQQGELAGLTPQQLQIVKDTYQVAQQLYSQGKFEYCKSEIRKIHNYTESYQDSKKLAIACALAADNQRRQHDLEQKKKKASETEVFIQKITNQCDEKFESFTFKHDLIDCLNSAIELAPADGRIQGLIERFEAIEIEKEEKEKQIVERRKFINSISSKYNYAKSLYVKGKVLKAMKAYQHFISISNHRELKQKQKLAQRELASMKKKFNDTNNRLNSECESFFKANKLQEAYYACEIAKEKIPSPYDQKAINFMNQSKSKLELTMRPLYEEANLNESVGNISIAMEYWKKILEKDVKAGLYYNRAATKMAKY